MEPDGFPLWMADVEPGSVHDPTGRWRTLHHITASPSKIDDIVKAALVLTHFEHGRLT